MQKIRNRKVKDMGKIRLANGQELEIIADGIQAFGNTLVLSLVPGDKNIMEYETLLSEAANTSKIPVSYTHLWEWETTFTSANWKIKKSGL